MLFTTVAALLCGTPDSATSQPAQAAPPAAQAVDAAALVEGLARTLADYFVFPDVAKRYGAALKAKLAAGAYAGFSDPAGLAARLTADLQATAKDGHLRVFPPRVGGAGPAHGGRPVVVTADGTPIPGAKPQGEPARVMVMQRPPAIPASGWIADGVAYIRFDGFPGDPETLQKVDDFVAAHAGATTLIIDARQHRGGGLDEMDHLFPQLFRQRADLVMMDTRAAVEAGGMGPLSDGKTLLRQPSSSEVVRRLHVVLPAAKPLLGNARVFLLTSKATASAGEHLALALKRTQRATLIGETTYGAGNFGGEIGLPGGFRAFVPGGRSHDPATGVGWEGTGVTPDVKVPAADALNKALELAGVIASQRRPLAGVS
ncbi:S41 family peptidase [Sandarakinorhabdus sp.]|uniref:S41 family peptidase n=1 Tax=Sandarakinorhabdus sp. TaxID=1916663 RepID=UPI00286E5369|nr:S41 family peptidase [Sandarakinorhabdus sp.]